MTTPTTEYVVARLRYWLTPYPKRHYCIWSGVQYVPICGSASYNDDEYVEDDRGVNCKRCLRVVKAKEAT